MLNIQSIATASFEKWRRTTLIICLFVASQTVFSQSKYIRQYKPLADSLSEVYKIPTAVILGVAIIESGAGSSRNSKLLHNHFGIKGKNDLLKTKGIRSGYKQYDNAAESYIAFCKLLRKRKYYDKLKGNMNHHVWLDAMSKHGYSEEPVQWKERITAAIRKHKLSSNY